MKKQMKKTNQTNKTVKKKHQLITVITFNPYQWNLIYM